MAQLTSKPLMHALLLSEAKGQGQQQQLSLKRCVRCKQSPTHPALMQSHWQQGHSQRPGKHARVHALLPLEAISGRQRVQSSLRQLCAVQAVSHIACYVACALLRRVAARLQPRPGKHAVLASCTAITSHSLTAARIVLAEAAVCGASSRLCSLRCPAGCWQRPAALLSVPAL